MKMVLASGNRNKYLEMRDEFAKAKIELIFGKETDVNVQADETGDTYKENALIKARAWALALGIPAVSDDSGLEVAALSGRPGVHSARIIEGTDKDRTAWLLAQMKGQTDRNARFVSCIVAAFPKTDEIVVCEKYCYGRLSEEERGTFGFGYDPIFIPDGYDKTFAELGDDVKRKISHRALAIKGIAEMLIPVLQYGAVHVCENAPL